MRVCFVCSELDLFQYLQLTPVYAIPCLACPKVQGYHSNHYILIAIANIFHDAHLVVDLYAPF